MRLLPANGRIVQGSIDYQGYDLATMKENRLRGIRWKHISIIFQGAMNALNPVKRVGEQIAEPIILHDKTDREAAMKRVGELLVADEPVSMLDVSIRTEILELLLELRAKKGLTFLFITHDLSLAWVLADRIGVMYLGKIVEEGPTRELIKNPRHPYTKALVSVVPVPDPDRRRERIILKGERPDRSDLPAGCRFHPRCPVAFERCGWTADEVASGLTDLAAAGSTPSLFASAKSEGPLAFTLTGPPAEMEIAIHRLRETKSEEARALKAIRTVEAMAGGIRVSLHDFSEPDLKSVTTDVKVSCHLFA